MGYDLFSERSEHEPTYFSANIHSYPKLLALAEIYGWEAQGTLPPSLCEPDDPEQRSVKNNNWSGSYYGNDYQVVSDSDAQAMADALERAINKIPNHIWECADLWNKKILMIGRTKRKFLDQTEYNKRYVELVNIIGQNLGCSIHPSVIDSENPISYFRGNNKEFLADFIKFCRNGAFQIS